MTKTPNIVVILMDNLGYGELGCYGGGILRGAPTPRIDGLASEGTRLLNFNVEAQCTPSRAAFMTGRYPIRGGNATVPNGRDVYGLMQSEISLARLLSDAGYATGIFGKWHLGNSPGRYPTDHGFDEWIGIPNSSGDAFWPTNEFFDPNHVKLTNVLEARKGEAPRPVRVFDLDARARMDREVTDRTKSFMRRCAGEGKRFFAYVPYTLMHWPTLAHPDFAGSTRNGMWADSLAQMDAYTGELLDTIDELGIRDDTLFIFTSDNGPEMNRQWAGSSGPWRGTYFTALEGSLRVPFIARWPGRIPAGEISNEIVHIMDLYPTLARIGGTAAPTDRLIDGVDQTDFLTAAQRNSNREHFICYVGSEIFGIKWRDWKVTRKEMERGSDPVKSYSVYNIVNLLIDPKEELSEVYRLQNRWVMTPVSRLLEAHAQSLRDHPPVAPGTPDPV
jgi:arylsulfatase A-like enzyme